MQRMCFSYLLPAYLLALLVGGSTCSPIHNDTNQHHQLHRAKRAAPTLDDREHCGPDDPQPTTRVNTSARVAAMRDAMTSLDIQAFIVLSNDAHGSEYPADSDLRRGFISGFTGSAGSAVVTIDYQAAWTDGRYFLEAEAALDCDWLFMKSGEKDVPTITGWLLEVMDPGDKVGADPFLVSNSQWKSMETALSGGNISLVAVDKNPVDTAWTDQPEPPKTDINALDMKYAGKRWEDKIRELHTEMESRDVHGAFVVTSLDEVAWLYNLRASDIEYNPFFLAYSLIEYYGENHANNTNRLYIYNKTERLTMEPSDSGTTTKLHQHLNTGMSGSCAGMSGMCVEVLDYNSSQVVADIQALAQADPANKIWVTFLANYAIFNAIPEAQRVQERSSIALAKAQKNQVERDGMEKCYNRDSAVLVEFLAMLDKEVKAGENWTEVSAAAELKKRRLAAEKNRGLSFGSISGSGPNGAVIHYRPAPDTDRQLTPDEMYLLDSGGQYLDGTTDVTRTMHYGTPSEYMKECYTRVLMGSIDLATMVWPEGLYGREIDMAARAPLWSVGLEYRHGTGHGIGAYLSVHEGPGFISLSHSPFYSQELLMPGMYFSDEPGFYEDGHFGIRLETIVMVEPTNTTHKFGTKQFLRFKPITLVPFEPHLIDYSLLSASQINWLNAYNQLTRTTIEPLLTTDLARAWLRERTEPYTTPTSTSSASITLPTLLLSLAAFTFALVL